jgi:hypothetical protein
VVGGGAGGQAVLKEKRSAIAHIALRLFVLAPVTAFTVVRSTYADGGLAPNAVRSGRCGRPKTGHS